MERKKSLLTPSIKIALWCCFLSSALMVQGQHCTGITDSSNLCDASIMFNEELSGFESNINAPCITAGELTDMTVPVRTYHLADITLDTTGYTDTMFRMKIKSIANLPCGLCWAINRGDQTVGWDDIACIRITGTTTDSIGQYELQVIVDIDMQGQGIFTHTNVNLADITTIQKRFILRLVPPEAVCLPINYSITSKQSSVTCE